VRKYKASAKFWKNFDALQARQKAKALRAFEIFKGNPWDSRLDTHEIKALSAEAGKTVYAVTIEGNLKVVFCVLKDDTIFTINIGTHKIYKP